MGFKMLELEHYKEYDLGEARVSCSPVGGFDSWLCVKSDKRTALNLNDCRAETSEELEELSQKLGDVDVLLTQFGWANWVGNPFDGEAKERAKSLLDDRIENQLAVLRPKYVIPFASFCWFSHEENSFCNNDSVTVQDFVNKYDDKNVVVLYPEDEWVVGEEIDCSESIEKWVRACEVIKSPKNKTSSVSLGQLQGSFAKMRGKMLECNDWSEILKLKAEEILEPAVIYLTDLDEHVTFDITNDELSKPMVLRGPDITMSSESLDYVMKFAWGRGTLMVNGRFQAAYETLHRFLRQTQIYYGNNIGKTYPRDITREELLNPKCFVYETIKGK